MIIYKYLEWYFSQNFESIAVIIWIYRNTLARLSNPPISHVLCVKFAKTYLTWATFICLGFSYLPYLWQWYALTYHCHCFLLYIPCYFIADITSLLYYNNAENKDCDSLKNMKITGFISFLFTYLPVFTKIFYKNTVFFISYVIFINIQNVNIHKTVFGLHVFFFIFILRDHSQCTSEYY